MDRGRRPTIGFAALLCALVATQVTSAADIPPHIRLAHASRLSLSGKSTLHDYSSTATRMDLSVGLVDPLPAGASLLARLAGAGAVQSFILTIPVEAMKSDKNGLDQNIYKALKATANPNIVFRLTAPPVLIDGENAAFRLTGELEVAGQAQNVELDVRASETSEGIVVEGSKALLMSDFGIKPPTMFLGTLKTADRVDIEWRIVLTGEGY